MESSGFGFYLDKLRARPEASRRRYAFVAALLLTLAIGAAELINLRHSPVVAGPSLAKVVMPEGQVAKPETGTWERIVLGWQQITARAAQLFQK